jgi:glycosyltransferase involved in cell wall biosynthesis
MSLWDAGIGSTIVALELATDRFRDGRLNDAAFLLTSAFGPRPTDHEARALMAEIQLELRPSESIDLIGELWKTDARCALIRIDALRATDAFLAANSAIEDARQRFPHDSRFLVRQARTQEMIGNWSEAISAWEQLLRDGSEPDTAPSAQIVRLRMRFEERDEANALAAQLLATKLPMAERLRMASHLGQTPMLQAIIEASTKSGSRRKETQSTARWLRNHGYVGALAWMDARIQNASRSVREAVDGSISPSRLRDIKTGTLQEALKVKSPACLLPVSQSALEAFRQTSVPLAGTGEGAYLLVNATLSAGGAERQFVMLTQALKRSGIPPENLHVAVFSLVADRGHAHFLQALEEEQVTIHHLRGARRMQADAAGDIAPFLNLLPNPLRGDVLALLPLAMRLDPVLLHGWQDRAGLACGIVGLLLGLRQVVMSSRNMRPDLRGDSAAYGAQLYRHLLTQYQEFTLTANSEAGAQDYADWIGLPSQTIPVLGNAIDTRRFPAPLHSSNTRTSQSRKPQPLTIGGVFRLAANKRPELWLRTLAALKPMIEQPLRLKLVGRGPFEARVRKLAQELGFSDIEISSGLSDLQAIYSSVDALLLMSRVEGTPNVLLEAQACGVPVAACDVGGVREAICPDGPGQGLILAENILPEDAAAKLAHWLPNTAHPEAPKARRDFVLGKYGNDALMNTVRRLYGLAAE